MTTYEEFLKTLKHNTLTDEEYYSNLVRFKDDLLLDAAKTNQGIVARKLGMHHTKLSAIFNILRLDIKLINRVREIHPSDMTSKMLAGEQS